VSSYCQTLQSHLQQSALTISITGNLFMLNAMLTVSVSQSCSGWHIQVLPPKSILSGNSVTVIFHFYFYWDCVVVSANTPTLWFIIMMAHTVTLLIVSLALVNFQFFISSFWVEKIFVKEKTADFICFPEWCNS